MPPAGEPQGYRGRSTAPARGSGRADDYYRAFQLVYIDQATGDVVLRFHKTDIVRVRPNGEVILYNGGYFTATTALSMNDALYPLDMEVTYTGNAAAGRWYLVEPSGNELPYDNHMVIPAREEEHKKRGEWLLEAYGGRSAVQALAATRTRLGQQRPSGAPAAAARPVAAAPAGGAPAAPVGSAWGVGGLSAAQRLAAGTAAANPYGAAHAASYQQQYAARQQQPLAAQPQQQIAPQQPMAAAVRMPAAGPAAAAALGARIAASEGMLSVEEQVAAAVETLGIADDHDDHLCVICMENMRNTVLVPCGHMIMCDGCCKGVADREGQCPLCRNPIEEFCKIMG